MVELTVPEKKIGQVMGLAMAAQGATEKIATLAKEEGETELVQVLDRMHRRRQRPRSVASSVLANSTERRRRSSRRRARSSGRRPR